MYFSEIDWQYKMRRDMQEIIPGLYLGPYAVAAKSKLGQLKSAGITHIVCVRHQLEASIIAPNFPEHFMYLVLNISDDARQNIIQFFPQVNHFISSCLHNGGKVLVHGNGGTSRSAALVVAFIMQHFGLPLKEAYICVQNRRFCISLNEGFQSQLEEYEPIYRAQILQSQMARAQILQSQMAVDEVRLSKKRKFEVEQEAMSD